MSGRLIAVVGASGVGKDSVIAGLAARLPGLHIVRREITRHPALGGEDFTPVDRETFAAREAAGAYVLSWQAHGLHYGIPRALQELVAGGSDAIVNLSRTVLDDAARRFARLTVLHVTVRPETLTRRLAARGRESAEGIAARLTRQAIPLPAGLDVLEISNDGPLAATIAQALAALSATQADGADA